MNILKLFSFLEWKWIIFIDRSNSDGGTPFSRYLRFTPMDVYSWCSIEPTASRYKENFRQAQFSGMKLAQADHQTLNQFITRTEDIQRIMETIRQIHANRVLFFFLF